MIKSTYLTLIICLPVFCFSQTYIDTYDPKDKDVKSLLSKENDLAGFGGADIKLSKMVDDRTVLTGMYGGLIINRHYLLGIGAYGLMTENDYRGTYPNDPTERRLNLHGGYGGIIIGATVFTREIIHLSFPVLIGAGSMDVVDNKFFGGTNADVTIEQSRFAVFEPAAQIEINITQRFRIAGGVSYRYVTASGFSGLENADLTGLSSVLSFRLGRY